MNGATVRNIFGAFLLSLTLTFGLAILYIFYPVISMVLSGLFNSRSGTSGIAVVVGGVSESLLFVLLIIEPVVFLLIFALLQRRRRVQS